MQLSEVFKPRRWTLDDGRPVKPIDNMYTVNGRSYVRVLLDGTEQVVRTERLQKV